MMADMKIELGMRVRDTISGFTGIATCVSKFLNGCVRVTVSPEKIDKGVPVADGYFDEQQLEVVAVKTEARKLVQATERAALPGGPRKSTPRRPDVKR